MELLDHILLGLLDSSDGHEIVLAELRCSSLSSILEYNHL